MAKSIDDLSEDQINSLKGQILSIVNGSTFKKFTYSDKEAYLSNFLLENQMLDKQNDEIKLENNPENLLKLKEWAFCQNDSNNESVMKILLGNKNYYSSLDSAEKYNEIDKSLKNTILNDVCSEINTAKKEESFETTYTSKVSGKTKESCIIKQNHQSGISEVQGEFNAQMVAKVIQANGGKAALSGAWKFDDFKNLLQECSTIGVNLNNISFNDEKMTYLGAKKADFNQSKNDALSEQNKRLEKSFNDNHNIFYNEYEKYAKAIAPSQFSTL
ncbi:hypothetical protein L3V83_11195 [Thiotrichales bacterium 19X7-9]|nr:hypothetical protein [Thiotrichales bacterium 19X7-9]